MSSDRSSPNHILPITETRWGLDSYSSRRSGKWAHAPHDFHDAPETWNILQGPRFRCPGSLLQCLLWVNIFFFTLGIYWDHQSPLLSDLTKNMPSVCRVSRRRSRPNLVGYFSRSFELDLIHEIKYPLHRWNRERASPRMGDTICSVYRQRLLASS